MNGNDWAITSISPESQPWMNMYIRIPQVINLKTHFKQTFQLMRLEVGGVKDAAFDTWLLVMRDSNLNRLNSLMLKIIFFAIDWPFRGTYARRTNHWRLRINRNCCNVVIVKFHRYSPCTEVYE